MHCVDLGESFPTSIYLQKSASIQPRSLAPRSLGENSIHCSFASLVAIQIDHGLRLPLTRTRCRLRSPTSHRSSPWYACRSSLFLALAFSVLFIFLKRSFSFSVSFTFLAIISAFAPFQIYRLAAHGTNVCEVSPACFRRRTE